MQRHLHRARVVCLWLAAGATRRPRTPLLPSPKLPLCHNSRARFDASVLLAPTQRARASYCRVRAGAGSAGSSSGCGSAAWLGDLGVGAAGHRARRAGTCAPAGRNEDVGRRAGRPSAAGRASCVGANGASASRGAGPPLARSVPMCAGRPRRTYSGPECVPLPLAAPRACVRGQAPRRG
ncbi:hypothetical protein BC834DRAFT_333521 [Gloeopeniophorella convolvens]|nr:hypothetical protein BC834DRAFT_333521 [Gloeopeniophorella convolvens]